MAYKQDSSVKIVTPTDMRGFIPNGWSGLSNEFSYYGKVPELNAAINIGASAFSSGTFKVFDGDKEIENTIIHNPNYLQSQKQWMKEMWIHSWLLGNWFMYKRVLEGFDATEDNIKAIWNIPKNELEAIATESKIIYNTLSIEEIIKSYSITNNGATIRDVNPKLIYHSRDIDTTIASVSDLTSNERFDSLKEVLKNIIAAYEGRGNLITSRGAVGALTNKSSQEDKITNIPMTDDQKTGILDRWKKRFGLTKGKDPVIILEGDWDFKRMVFNASELGLHTECERDLEMISNVFEMPIDLFARQKASTFANKEYALKQLYQNTVIPFAEEKAQVLQKEVFQNKKQVVADFSEVPILQDDFKLNAETQAVIIANLTGLFEAGQISESEMHEKLLGYGII